MHFLLSYRPNLGTKGQEIPDPIMRVPVLNPFNTIPKSTLNILLDSLLDSPDIQLSTKNQEKATTVATNEQLTLVYLGDDLIDLEEKIYNQTRSSENATESVVTEDTVKESSIDNNEVASPGPNEVAEASSPGHVTLQSFLAAISQSREEESQKEPATEGPVILPFRTTLRTTTIATTTTTTATTTTTGKLWLTMFILKK
jgi:hypothetical protein